MHVTYGIIEISEFLGVVAERKSFSRDYTGRKFEHRRWARCRFFCEFVNPWKRANHIIVYLLFLGNFYSSFTRGVRTNTRWCERSFHNFCCEFLCLHYVVTLHSYFLLLTYIQGEASIFHVAMGQGISSSKPTLTIEQLTAISDLDTYRRQYEEKLVPHKSR